MDNNATLLIILILLVIVLGGGWYGRGRWVLSASHFKHQS
jgi:hypothetical protein